MIDMYKYQILNKWTNILKWQCLRFFISFEFDSADIVDECHYIMSCTYLKVLYIKI
jgi:hypothetical protein